MCDISDQNIVLEPNFETMNWLGSETNSDPGVGAEGLCSDSVEDGPIARLELVGFIYEFPFEQAVAARHADAVIADGGLR